MNSNKEYKPIRISEEEDTRKLVWGVVTYSIKQLRKPAERKTHHSKMIDNPYLWWKQQD